jgi:hypothetical protein
MTGSFIAGIAFATAATTEAAPSGTMIAKNNIIISNETGMKTWGIRRVGTGGTFTSDHNVIYRANTTNGFIGYFNASDVTDLAAWKTASSQDANSKSVAVNFVSATDLSLTGASIGDYNLAVPRQTTVLTDIAATNRAALTYAGAYEASDLTTVAKQFTVTVPNGTAHVYIAGDFTGKFWDNTTPFELTSTGTANQFSGIFPCVDGVQYKYLCGLSDWEYQDASSVNPLTEQGNRTYNATDVVAYWKAMPKVTFNVTFAGTTGVPSTLFVKGGWDSWAAPITLTKSGSTYSGFIGGNTGDKIYSNTEYKYYTTDLADPNWEVNADNTNRSNRWTIYPTMNDVIDLFGSPITGLNEAGTATRIMRTASGIEVNVDNESAIELYNISGTLIDKTNIKGSYSHDLNNGIYIIRINGKATKFVK